MNQWTQREIVVVAAIGVVFGVVYLAWVQLWLVAQGWVHPTDSSVNVALGQGRHAPPAGLSLQVADAAGRFKPARAGRHTLLVRAFNRASATQPAELIFNPAGYHNNVVQRVDIEVA